MTGKNRRDVLKKITAATTGISLTSAQPVAAATCDKSLSIRVWPALDVGGRDDFPEAYDCDNALDNFLNQLESAGAIGNGTSTVSSSTIYQEFGINLTTCDTDDCTCGENCTCADCTFDDDDRAAIRDAIYASSYDEDVHVIVAEITNFAGASHGDHNAYIKDDDANKKGTGFAWIGTDGPYPGTDETTERYKNLAIQETGHVIVNDEGWDDGYTEDGDHAMGKIVKDYWDSSDGKWHGPATPMATFYESSDDTNPCCNGMEDASSLGDCKNDAIWDETHTREVTSCTINGVMKTCFNEDGAY